MDAFLKKQGLAHFSGMHLRYYDRDQIDTDHAQVIHSLPEHYFAQAALRLGAELPLVIVTNNPDKAAFFAEKHLRNAWLVSCQEDPLIDFYLLTRAEKLAISNSSFSWWAAYLNEGASIYAPQRSKWFSFQARMNPLWDTRDLYPDRFIQIPI